jgi:hypothetical protein
MAAASKFRRAVRRDAHARVVEFSVRFGEKEAAGDLMKKQASADATLLIAPTKQVPTHFHFVYYG